MYLLNKILLFAIISAPCIARAACDCASTDESNPCTGNAIAITVTAGTPNNGTAVNSQFNWAFNSGGGDARCGQFANGDYWIAPAQGQSSVTVTGITSTGSITADENPHPGRYGLLNGAKAYSGYNAAENIIPSLPKSYTNTTSIVAAIQRNEATEGACGTPSIKGECVDAYNVVTVLSSVPANAGSTVIRPNITGTTKEILNLSAFDLSRIPAKSFLAGTNAAGLEAIRRRWSHSTEIFSLNWTPDGTNWYSNSEGGRAYRSHILLDDYAAGTSATLHSDIATLFSDDNTPTEKMKPIAAMLSYGLDMYHAIFDPPSGYTTTWASGAGQHLGKFTPVALLAALEINNSTRLNNVKSVGIAANNKQPQELAQLFVGPNGPVWGDADTTTRYWNDLQWSQCWDTAASHVTYDYWTLGQWKTFSIPVGQYYTGAKRFTFLHSNWSGKLGDLKIRNVAIDGVPIDFGSVTLQDYAGATGSGTVEDGGATYSMATGTSIGKQTTNTYTLTADSVLTFEWYQTAIGWAASIGFDEDATYDSTKRLVQITGVWAEPNSIQQGCNNDVGQKTAADPYHYIDGPANEPGSQYFGIGYAGILNFAAIMHLMPEFRAAVNTSKSMDFVDRARTHGIKTLPDPCVTPDTRENFSTCNVWTGGTNCQYYYPTGSTKTWGPISLSDDAQGCVTTSTSGYTQQGRFASIDGQPAPIVKAYTSSQLYNNWGTIRARGAKRLIKLGIGAAYKCGDGPCLAPQ